MSSAALVGQRLPTDHNGRGDVVAAYGCGLVRTRSGLLWRHGAGRLITPDAATLARVAYLKRLRAVLPAELVAWPGWVCWRLEGAGDRSKGRKVPVSVSGGRARSNDCRTWSTFERAGLAFLERGDGWAGLGFMFGESAQRRSGFVGVDLDGCFDGDGLPAAWAAEILSMTAGAYVEYSPSGKGLHVITRGVLASGRCRVGPVEVYQFGRFFTMTGRVYG